MLNIHNDIKTGIRNSGTCQWGLKRQIHGILIRRLYAVIIHLALDKGFKPEYDYTTTFLYSKHSVAVEHFSVSCRDAAWIFESTENDDGVPVLKKYVIFWVR